MDQAPGFETETPVNIGLYLFMFAFNSVRKGENGKVDSRSLNKVY